MLVFSVGDRYKWLFFVNYFSIWYNNYYIRCMQKWNLNFFYHLRRIKIFLMCCVCFCRIQFKIIRTVLQFNCILIKIHFSCLNSVWLMRIWVMWYRIILLNSWRFWRWNSFFLIRLYLNYRVLNVKMVMLLSLIIRICSFLVSVISWRYRYLV